MLREVQMTDVVELCSVSVSRIDFSTNIRPSKHKYVNTGGCICMTSLPVCNTPLHNQSTCRAYGPPSLIRLNERLLTAVLSMNKTA